MPAAHAAARSAEAGARAARDGEARVAAGAALPVVAAQELAMAPVTYVPFLGCSGSLFAVIAVGTLLIYTVATGHQRGDSVLLVASAAAGLLATVCVVALPRSLRRRQQIKAGRPAAEAVWRRGWYCYRCAVVYFHGGEQPPGVTPGQPLTPAQFRHLVWTTGRF